MGSLESCGGLSDELGKLHPCREPKKEDDLELVEVTNDAEGKGPETLLANGVDLMSFVSTFPEHSDQAQTWWWTQGQVKVSAVSCLLF